MRVTLPGADPSSITHQLGDFGQESLTRSGPRFPPLYSGPITYHSMDYQADQLSYCT